MTDAVTITLTRRQAELLSTLIADMNGRLQYRAIKTHPSTTANQLDKTFAVWQGISERIAKGLGGVYKMDNKHVSRLIDVTREKI